MAAVAAERAYPRNLSPQERKPYLFQKPQEGRTISEPELFRKLEDDLTVILQEQHPITGLFPAATREHFVAEDQYHKTWFRDTSIIAAGLLDPKIHAVLAGQPLDEKVRSAGVHAVKGMLRIAGEDRWKEAFTQNISVEIDEQGRVYKRLSEKAPAVQVEINGEKNDEWEDNQPDSWGELLSATASALKQNLIVLTPEEEETVTNIVNYLLNIDVPNFEQVAMWEWTHVHHPAPTSTLAITAKGLEDIKPYIGTELHRRIDRMVNKERREIEKLYPTEYTTQEHASRTDFATLVALGQGTLKDQSPTRYFLAANPELGNGQFPGKMRFVGDRYYAGPDGAAIWPSAYEAKIFLDHAIDAFEREQPRLAEQYRAKGMEQYFRIKDVVDFFAYHTELLIRQEGKLVANNNDLLWHRIVMAQASARAILANRLAA